MFKQLSRTLKYKNPWMTVYEDKVEFPDGSSGIYGVVERKHGAVAAVLNENDEILLIRQYRYPVHQEEWNIPGGGIDEGEDAETAIRREIEEETGLKVASIEKIGTFYALSSFSTESETLFLARVEGNMVMQGDQFDEYISRREFFPLAKALEMIDNGEITEICTAMAIQIAARRVIV